ncbi:Thg1 C terminal domain-containing protein [Suillus bovinus]|uniref:Thg1 C terminal domain-containing protein n=1 Tax=Suillus bovinus TaxID=48563 RepID=UPI001B860588|nr:Thg1 C terminal domain-containing protein [Suillus bovinus]KAG2145325.1 Thg1 C terminal domain-containing protein [Suillus bovinus]
MAGTKFAYVRNFELPDPLLPDTYLVCRLDGHSFHRFSDEHGFAKPNDERALQLMDHAAKSVMTEFKDIMLAFGESDEFSFLFRKSTNLYNRRHSKILTTLTSYLTSCYVFNWSRYFPDTPLRYPPSFDGRIIVYPTERAIRDYFSWRQADTHINNLYNTTFWALIQKGGQTTTEAHATLRGTVSATKHEMLFSRFGINYNEISQRFKKGSIIVREIVAPESLDKGENLEPPMHLTRHEANQTPDESPECSGASAPTTNIPLHSQSTDEDGETPPFGPPRQKRFKAKKKNKPETTIEVLHCDIIGDEFWLARPHLLEN